MKNTIQKNDIALITTERVVKSFDNEDAYLHAVIVPLTDDPIKKIRTYKVRTDLVGYKEVQVFDADINDYQTKQELTFLEQKQDWSLQKFTYAQIDAFSSSVASLIPEGLTRTQQSKAELEIIFLQQRQNDAPWGIAADNWKIRTVDDLLKEEAKNI